MNEPERQQMTSEEKVESAKNYRDFSFAGMQTASRRGAELSDEFARLEVQIATILIAFASLFINGFGVGFSSFSFIVVFGLKLIFASSLFFLILSLVLGLLHIKRKEHFWDEAMHFRTVRLNKWIGFLKKESSYE